LVDVDVWIRVVACGDPQQGLGIGIPSKSPDRLAPSAKDSLLQDPLHGGHQIYSVNPRNQLKFMGLTRFDPTLTGRTGPNTYEHVSDLLVPDSQRYTAMNGLEHFPP